MDDHISMVTGSAGFNLPITGLKSMLLITITRAAVQVS